MGMKVDKATMARILETADVGPKVRARARHEPGRMNKLEAAYAANVLDVRRLAGEIADYRFEPIRFVLANLTSYTPDFMVILADGAIEFHELKAVWSGGRVGWEDDARVKIKVAARLYPMFAFAAIAGRKTGSGWVWQREDITA